MSMTVTDITTGQEPDTRTLAAMQVSYIPSKSAPQFALHLCDGTSVTYTGALAAELIAAMDAKGNLRPFITIQDGKITDRQFHPFNPYGVPAPR